MQASTARISRQRRSWSEMRDSRPSRSKETMSERAARRAEASEPRREMRCSRSSRKRAESEAGAAVTVCGLGAFIELVAVGGFDAGQVEVDGGCGRRSQSSWTQRFRGVALGRVRRILRIAVGRFDGG